MSKSVIHDALLTTVIISVVGHRAHMVPGSVIGHVLCDSFDQSQHPSSKQGFMTETFEDCDHHSNKQSENVKKQQNS